MLKSLRLRAALSALFPGSALELLLHIASQLSDGIGATLTAVLHLFDDLAQLLLDLPLLLWRGRLDMGELVLGDEGHDIMDVDAHLLYLAGDNQARPTVIDSRSILAGVQGFESLSPHLFCQ